MKVIKKLIIGLLFATSSVCAMQLPENNVPVLSINAEHSYKYSKLNSYGRIDFKICCVDKNTGNENGHIIYSQNAEKAATWDIDELVIDFKKRGKHIGSNLLKLCIQDIKNRNGKIVNWIVSSTNYNVSNEQLASIYGHIVKKYIDPEMHGTLQHSMSHLGWFGTVHSLSYTLPDSATASTNTNKSI